MVYKILYFVILQITLYFLIKFVNYWIEEDKKLKINVWKLRKAYRKQEEEYIKQEFLWKIKNGLSTSIDKPKSKHYRNSIT